ncbi:hypothetical protein P7C73_g4199, partial [Tremellales sp. Uapishka_1]
MSMNHHIPKKISFKPKKHHGFQAFLFLMGCLLPPIAVAFRFGIGTDFFINTFLCICGYFPCHFHNFYIQNIRNNSNKARTPKWASRYGLVDQADAERKAKKSQWAKRYDERNSHSTHAGAALEEGEEGENYEPIADVDVSRQRNEGLWVAADDEEYYNEDEAPNQKKWHYPANFEGAVGDGRSKRKGNDANGDRWERTRQAQAGRPKANSVSSGRGYPPSASSDNDVPEWGRDYGSKKKSSKKNKASPQADYGFQRDEGWGNGNDRANANGNGYGNANGNGYENGNGYGNGGAAAGAGAARKVQNGEPNWDHEF